MDPDIRHNRLLRTQLIAMNILGLVHFKDAWSPRFQAFRGYFVFVFLTAFNVTQYMYMYYYWGDLLRITSRVGTLVLYTALSMRALTSIIYREKYSQIITEMHAKMTEIEQNGHADLKKILDECVKRNDMVINCVLVCIMISVILFNGYVISAFFIINKPDVPIEVFAVAVLLPFPIEEHRIFIIFYLELLIIIVIPMVTFWNTMALSLLMYVQCIIKFLNYKIRNFKDFSEETEDHEFLEQCIEEHLCIIRLVQDIAHIINIPMNMDFLVVALVLCVEVFITSFMSLGIELYITWGYIATILSIFFMYYWHANEIIIESSNLADAAFEAPWLDADFESKRALMLIIQRAHKPLIMRAGFQPMNMQTFLMVLRTSYSAVAVLRHMHED